MQDYQSINKIARYGFLIDAGVIAATLSSAMASFLGGPRILQSLSNDRVFPFLVPFAKGAGPTNNPRRAILLTLGIALATVGLGQLNLVARVVSMFFLISYGLLNYATYYEAHAESPSFRPRFRWFNKYLSLLGCLICLGIILALDIQNGLIALAILLAIYHYLKQTAGPSRWADSSSAHAFQVIRHQLSDMAGTQEHDRNWRPHILAFTNHAERRVPLLTFSEWIEGQSGLITAVRLIEGDRLSMKAFRREAEEELRAQIKAHDFNIFPLVVQTEDVTSAIPLLLQSYGIGPLRANTVLVNWYGQSGSGVHSLQALKYGHDLRTAFRMGYNLIVLHHDVTEWDTLVDSNQEDRRIDVWWRADATSRLMLLLAYLMTRQKVWRRASIRVLTAGTGERLSQAKQDLIKTLEEVRIDAQAQIVKDMTPETVVAQSAKSSFAFLPFRIREFKLCDINGYSLNRMLPQLPPTALVMAAEDIDLDAEPEAGSVGELAEAMDAFREAERRATKSTSALNQAKQVVDSIKSRIAAMAQDSSIEEKTALEKELVKAEKDVETAFRKSAKANARVEDSAKAVRELGGPATENKADAS